MMFKTIKGIIFDVDGVLEYQGKVFPHAVETLRDLRNRGLILRFLSNSTLKSRASCANKLRQLGITVFDKEVFTASYITAEYLKLLKPRSCWIMLEGEGQDEFKEFRQDTEDPEYIVIGDNRSCFDFEHLNKALRMLLNGSKLIGMQSELVDSNAGQPELNVGSWVGMLERASGVHAIYIGKPDAFAFELTLQSMKFQNDQIAVVGDRISTDIAGAQRWGMHTVLVKTGEFSPMDLEDQVYPDFMVNDIRDINDIMREI